MSPLRFAVILVVFSLFATSCAAARAAAARNAWFTEAMTDYAFAAPLDDVLSMTRMVLVEKGLAPHDVGHNSIETDWSYASTSGAGGSSSSATRYLATAMRLGDATRLTIMLKRERSLSGSGGSSSSSSAERAFDLEVEVLRRLDPANGTRIKNEGEARAEAAANGK